MVFSRLLASVGIGAASVDTRISNPVLTPGGWMRGTINIKGGTVDQAVDRIDLALETMGDLEINDSDLSRVATIQAQTVVSAMMIKAGSMLEIPFEMLVPADTPLNQVYGHNFNLPIHLRTHVHLVGAVDSSDRDAVIVAPNMAQARILDALNNLSFRIFKADVEFGQIPGTRLPFFQELEFYAGHNLSHRIKELELTFVGLENDMDVILEVDKRSTGFSRLMNSSSDSILSFRVRYEDYQHFNWEDHIEKLLLR